MCCLFRTRKTNHARRNHFEFDLASRSRGAQKTEQHDRKHKHRIKLEISKTEMERMVIVRLRGKTNIYRKKLPCICTYVYSGLFVAKSLCVVSHGSAGWEKRNHPSQREQLRFSYWRYQSNSPRDETTGFTQRRKENNSNDTSRPATGTRERSHYCHYRQHRRTIKQWQTNTPTTQAPSPPHTSPLSLPFSQNAPWFSVPLKVANLRV